MVEVPKLVLMIQPNRLQGLIWQTVLKSQKISAIQETADSDLTSSISELKQAGLTLPDLLLIDINQVGFNPYSFCRWCRDNHPDVKIVLTNSAQLEISPPERQWALNQGAADLLPVFQIENLVSSVAVGTKRLLDILDYPDFDNAALISTLLRMKREFDARRFKEASGAIADSTSPVSEVMAPPLNGLQPTSANGNGNGNGTPAPAPAPPPQPQQPQQPPTVKRQYRGVSY
ncbi:MAG TPA: response regulator [Chroococcidiopsis sp.]